MSRPRGLSTKPATRRRRRPRPRRPRPPRPESRKAPGEGLLRRRKWGGRSGPPHFLLAGGKIALGRGEQADMRVMRPISGAPALRLLLLFGAAASAQTPAPGGPGTQAELRLTFSPLAKRTAPAGVDRC